MTQSANHVANEQQTIRYRLWMAGQLWAVSAIDAHGVRHSVEVTAGSIFEAAAKALTALTQNGWTEPLDSGTRLEVEVQPPAVAHIVTVFQPATLADNSDNNAPQ
jgi:hypothetical protein